VELYRTIGTKYEEIVIQPGTQETFKASTSDFTAESLITQRQKVSELIRENLSRRLDSYGIIVDQVNITNFDFSNRSIGLCRN
jgi:regulator of protease activity HflC (stomatin/prohibitin superfamily)